MKTVALLVLIAVLIVAEAYVAAWIDPTADELRWSN